MYTLASPLHTVKGIGPSLTQSFRKRDIETVKDVLLFLPLRYEDRSLKKLISQLIPGELVTVEGEVSAAGNFYKGQRSIQSATVKDQTGRLKLLWFNNPYVIQRLMKGKRILVSGKLNDRGTMLQPIVEDPSNDQIHTGRLVPIYSMIPGIAPTTLRKLLKHILDNLEPFPDELAHFLTPQDVPLPEALFQIHFPSAAKKIVSGRERFALEELLALIEHSRTLKKQWQATGRSLVIPTSELPQAFPFNLTGAQQRCIQEISKDLENTVPMNRLLIGDVGSGKTAVAGVACSHAIQHGYHAALAAPTQILAEQHMATFQKLLPHLPVQLVTSKTSAKLRSDLSNGVEIPPTVFIGTHAVLNLLTEIQPALLIYDEQHRFGVEHRSLAQHLERRPHVLTLSATPIPRTMMLTIFSHLNLSVIDELPPGRQPIQTWLVPEQKRLSSYQWLKTNLRDQQALIICPFIDPSSSEALENIAAAKDMHEQMKAQFPEFNVGLLHGRMSKKEQSLVTQALFDRTIQILVTTPIVEVGIDLPAATFVLIEAAERFGLASLHQLRGRVGRAGQEAFCLLFSNTTGGEAHQRLKQFCQIQNGMQLAEMDLQHRGAGDIFGTQQHGFDNLQFANWTNLQLIAKAKLIADRVIASHQKWHPFLNLHLEAPGETVPLAN